MLTLINVKANMPSPEEGYYMVRTLNCCKCIEGMPTDRCAIQIQCCKSTHPDCDPLDVTCGRRVGGEE